ncbi:MULTISPECIES: hypothetical protein [Anaerofustis]|uniref:hypothetical protein n=1 Tax=Anaerofustis TaxID=264995 RepID=UPI0011063F48|nr:MULTISPECIES: hypothetical protein [Anaerofustis]MCO8194313.1 hypothetical protein [Anaerofustis sp. NSJ-163]
MNEKKLNGIRFNVVKYLSNIIGLENLLLFENKKRDKKRLSKKIKIYYNLIYKEISPLKEENINIQNVFSFLSGEYNNVLKKVLKYYKIENK